MGSSTRDLVNERTRIECPRHWHLHDIDPPPTVPLRALGSFKRLDKLVREIGGIQRFSTGDKLAAHAWLRLYEASVGQPPTSSTQPLWHRQLTAAFSASQEAAERQLQECNERLEDFTERVYNYGGDP